MESASHGIREIQEKLPHLMLQSSQSLLSHPEFRGLLAEVTNCGCARPHADAKLEILDDGETSDFRWRSKESGVHGL
jgi:hypothetical protein